MTTLHAFIDQTGTTYTVTEDGTGGIEFIDETGATFSLTIDGSGLVSVCDEAGTEYLWGSTVITPSLGRYQATGNTLRELAMDTIVSALAARLGSEIPVVWDNAPGVTWLESDGVGGGQVARMSGFEELSAHRANYPTVHIGVGVRFGNGRMQEIGSLAQIEVSGELVLDVFAELHEGTGVSDRLVAALAQALHDYQGASLDLRLFSPTLSQPQRVDATGTRWVTRVGVPFRLKDDIPARPDDATPVLGGAFLDASISVRSRWRERIEVPNAIPTAYDNEQHAESAVDLWARLTVLTGETSRLEIGPSGVRRVPGVMQATIFAPIGAGDSAALAVADEVFDAFAGQAESRVQFGAPNLSRALRDDNSWRLDIRVPFTFDEV
jgi:hypothetical protein